MLILCCTMSQAIGGVVRIFPCLSLRGIEQIGNVQVRAFDGVLRDPSCLHAGTTAKRTPYGLACVRPEADTVRDTWSGGGAGVRTGQRPNAISRGLAALLGRVGSKGIPCGGLRSTGTGCV
jgi:hypothetical protein